MTHLLGQSRRQSCDKMHGGHLRDVLGWEKGGPGPRGRASLRKLEKGGGEILPAGMEKKGIAGRKNHTCKSTWP